MAATLSREVQALITFIERQGIPARVTATLGRYISPDNPCAPHSATSNHCAAGTDGKGLAVDWGGVTTGTGPAALAQMAAIHAAYLKVAPQLAELIHNQPGITVAVKDGRVVDGLKAYGPTTWAAHKNHVHVAVKRGVLLDRLVPTFLPDTIIEQAPEHDGEDMAEPVDAMCAPEGGVWVLTRDGGVRAYGGAPFHGSYPGLPPDQRQATDPFVDIGARDDGRDGYMLRNSGGALYRFP